jgi:dihydrofolate synthase/folylpolyglutamate synthase
MIKNHISYLLSLESKGIKLGLEKTKQLLKICGDPQKKFQSIQVIGTNGKGSTSAMIASILKASDYKVGLYTSPHLNKINERIRINGQSIQDNEIINFINQYQQSINKLNSSFFETMTALAVWYFEKEKVDIAILETGLGGRLDSITACDSNLLVCTSISKDHEHILGNTVEEIAYEKICALKKNMLCISSNHIQSIKDVFNKHAISVKSKIQYVQSNNYNQFINLNGIHQLENEILAINTIKHLTEFKIYDIFIKQGLSSVLWPGRIQKIYNKPDVYYDVAHNHASFESLCNYVNTLKGKKILVLALQKYKILNKIINKIERSFDKIIITQTNIRNFLPAEELACLFNINKINIINQVIEAVQIYKSAQKTDNIIIAGSHYLGPVISKEFKISFESI